MINGLKSLEPLTCKQRNQMEQWPYYLKIAGIIFSASGLWKLLELIFKARMDKKLKTAQEKNLYAQTQDHIVGNWIQWSQHLEQRVKELESVATENQKLTQMIETQKGRISQLEAKVKSLESENKSLKRQIIALKKN